MSLFKRNKKQINPATATNKVVTKKDKQSSQDVVLSRQRQKFAAGTLSLKDIIAPSIIEVDFDSLRVNNSHYRALFVIGYPRYVSSNWLEPLISFDHSLTISMFIYPQDSGAILKDLKHKIAQMEATVNNDLRRGRVVDPSVQISLDDALSLQSELAKGAERFFQFGLYITIPGTS